MAACRVRAVLVCLVVLGCAPRVAVPQTGDALNPAVRARAVAEYDAGRLAFRSERWDDAEARLQRAIRFDPHFPDAHYLLGRTYMELQRYRSAVHAYIAAQRAAVRLRDARRLRAGRLIVGEEEAHPGGARARVATRFAFPAALPLALGSAYHHLEELADAEREYFTAIERLTRSWGKRTTTWRCSTPNRDV